MKILEFIKGLMHRKLSFTKEKRNIKKNDVSLIKVENNIFIL